MKITLQLNKSLEENASAYYDYSKKSKKKLSGAEDALERSKKRLEEIKKEEIKTKCKKIERKKEWYEKFRWFFSSEGFLCIGGKDATSNDIIVKKHSEKNDIIFHTEMAGSPFFIVKNGILAGETTLNEAAQATASYSRGWKLGLGSSDVFYVNPDQVTKTANPGEYLAKGSFMIRGKTNYLHPKLELAVGILENGIIMAGAVNAVKKNCERFVLIKQGREKTATVAKKIQKQIGGELDEIIRGLPAGGCDIRK